MWLVAMAATNGELYPLQVMQTCWRFVVMLTRLDCGEQRSHMCSKLQCLHKKLSPLTPSSCVHIAFSVT